MTRYRYHHLPSGAVFTELVENALIYGTFVMPTSFIPFDDPEEIAANDRREAARKALSVLREAPPPEPVPTFAGQPCPTCTFKRVPRVLPPAFPLPPFEFAEPPRSPWQFDYLGAWPFPPETPWSGII